MTDQNTQFFAILTAIGKAKQANADALGIPWTFAQMGVGDANDTDPIPSEQQTQLINERRRAPLNQLSVDPTNPNIIVAEQIIPENVGGWWIREVGLYDADGDLVAVANCAPSFKPLLTQGSGRTQVVRMNLIVSNTANVELKIDPSVVLATRTYVDSKVRDELYKLDSKQSVRAATAGNIALTGLQTIDGVSLVAGDRVLVKNQAAAKDNGIYLVGAAAWLRAPDADSNAKVTSAMLVPVEQGTTLADTRWQLVTDGAITLGTTALTFQNITQGFATIDAPALINPTGNTPTRFDSSKRLTTTEWVRNRGVEYSGFFSFTAPLVGTLAHVGAMIHAWGAGPVSYSIPDSVANNIPLGATIRLQNWSNVNLLLTVQGADKMQEAPSIPSSAANRSIPPETYVDITYVGGGAWLLLGTGVFGKIAPFASLNSPNGCTKLPSGTILQWGSFPCGVNSTNTITLPVTFPNAFFHGYTTLTDNVAAVGSYPIATLLPLSTSTFSLRSYYTSSAMLVSWWAVGN
ncbi:phage tail protein [Pseudomonas sp. JL2]|uniref:phage tail protein n=1 Tax=Pseudomonas sp. JL2 TaxID=2919942 RepID=UPI002866A670|nr:phage tail protein [Pseudomonas sp. JL2]MDR8387447.1 phage tail protein [Pseudomonas sp. JL2]